MQEEEKQQHHTAEISFMLMKLSKHQKLKV